MYNTRTSFTPHVEVMMAPSIEETTQLVTLSSRGDERAANRLMPLVYDRLHELAEGYLHRERVDHTLQPTALVNEAYLKLVKQGTIDIAGQTHFMAIAARGMKQILIDYARKHRADKRGGKGQRITLDAAVLFSDEKQLDADALGEALEELARTDQRASQVVELRFFGGLSNAQVAKLLEVSVTTVEGDWRYARSWLHRVLNNDEGRL